MQLLHRHTFWGPSPSHPLNCDSLWTQLTFILEGREAVLFIPVNKTHACRVVTQQIILEQMPYRCLFPSNSTNTSPGNDAVGARPQEAVNAPCVCCLPRNSPRLAEYSCLGFSVIATFPTMLISYGCCNKWSHIFWLKTLKFII